MNTHGFLGHAILRTAYEHLGDGAGEDWADNAEYTRAVVEMTGDLLGMDLNNRDAILVAIRQSGEVVTS